MTIHQFIKKRPYLIWYVRDLDKLSEESIVEHTLNYGDWADVCELLAILGVKKTAAIFSRQISGKRINYDPKIMNYFKLYFSRYA
ncbi:MAG: hypothetical protein UW11_C0011G0004 [Parcubacteria group bacterium GW2011_GWA2_43_9b]|nr:MAG: hypothetical protein UW11_C0011G0004 [Parcubacteria group bacterium GW2011_GWA2_43_9b]